MELIFTFILGFIFSCVVGYFLIKKRVEKEVLGKGIPYILKDFK